MYTKIINPITNKSVSINTLLGKNILRHYINFLTGGNKVKNLKLELNKCKKKRINLERKIKNLEKEITPSLVLFASWSLSRSSSWSLLRLQHQF